MARQNIPNREKLAILGEYRVHKESGGSLRAFCIEKGLVPVQLKSWIKIQEKIENARSGACSVHKGRPSCLAPIEEDLLKWIFELREQGLGVSVNMVTVQACQMLPTFRRKANRHTRESAVRRFLTSHRLVIRASTHESQRDPRELQTDAKDFILRVRRTLQCAPRDPRWIINMDQTPLFFSMQPTTTIEVSGRRTVHVRTSTNSTMRITVAVTVTASGDQLDPMLVYKGKPSGRIQREFANFPGGAVYACQDRAWMDEQVMLRWVDEILKPHVSQAPDGIIPLLLLDSYRCHMMASVVEKIEDLGVEVIHIPGGCTPLCQPIDIGIGKPLKNRVRRLWEEWILAQGQQSVTKPVDRKTLAEWTVEALQSLEQTLISNSWKHQDYSYF